MVVINSNSKLIIQPAEITQHIRVNSNGNLTRTINENGTIIIGTTLDVEYNNVTITGNPTNDRDVATVEYVKNHIQGLDVKESVKCATIVNILDLSGLIQVDDITVQKGDRVLVKNQNNESQNGIYLADNSVWSRAQDFDAPNEVQGAFVFVEQGTTNAAKGFIQLSNAPVSIGNGPIKFTQFNGTYAFEAGDGVTQVGNTLNVDASLNHVTHMTGLVSIGNVDQDTTFFGAIVASQGIIGDLSGNASTATAAASSGVLRTELNELSSNLSTEASTARSAESVLSSNLSTEVSRAGTVEGTLSSNLSTEASTARSAESVLSSNLSTEASTARSAESVLSSNLSTEVSRAGVSEGTLSSRLSTEASTARSAESVLSSNLTTEVSRAGTAEGTLSSNLSTEVSRAGTAEGTLSSNLSTEVSRAGTAEGTLSSNLSTEVSRAGVAEGTLSSNLSTEASTTRSTESVLSSNLSTEISRAGTAEGTLSSNLSTEVSRAGVSEGTLSSNLSTEVSRAGVAEGTLSSRLSTEASTARSAESVLSSNLSTEVSTARYNESLKANLSGADFVGNVSIDGTLDISSSLIGLNVNNQGKDSGLLVMRKDASNVLIGWDENEEKFVLGLTNAINSATSEVGIITKGVLLADLSGNAETATNATNSDSVTVDISGELQVTNSQNNIINMNRGSYSSKFIIDPSGNLIINIGNQYFRYNLTSASNSYNGVGAA